MHGDLMAIADRDPGRLLATVLQRKEGEESEPSRLGTFGVDADNSALFLRPIEIRIPTWLHDQILTLLQT